ncbi:MAG: hypothetical protein IKE75_03130 [Bacilli bacterium]|nr:hypothetical protein [Bacilli bacterium]
MTEKELLYVDDAVSHEKSIINILEGSIKSLENEDLVSFMENEKDIHISTLDKLMSTLKEEANE